MEFFRDQAADQFERHTHSAWRPRSGSKVNHRTLTSAMIDSRDFLAAKRRADNEVLLPAGPKIAFTGGLDFNDHRLIWDKLDQVHAKHPDMVLLHGGSPKGAELIAAKWADHRKVPQIAFKPDWTKHAKAAPFKRNDADARRAADRGHGLPRHRHSGQPRRQGQEARHPGLEIRQRRRVSAAIRACLARRRPHEAAATLLILPSKNADAHSFCQFVRVVVTNRSIEHPGATGFDLGIVKHRPLDANFARQFAKERHFQSLPPKKNTGSSELAGNARSSK